MKLKGVYPVLITPMNKDGTINWRGLEENINYFIEKDVPGIVVNGSTGEFVSLTKEERIRIVNTASQLVNGKIKLIVGTAAETTSETIFYTKQAESAGADGALIINSYYLQPKENEIYEHYKMIAHAVDIPIMLYNNPHTTGVDIDIELILKLSNDFDNITHIKESSGEIRKVRDIIRSENDLILFCGCEDLALETLMLGAKGWISVVGNIVPDKAVRLFELVQNKKLEKAWELYDELLPLCSFLEESGKYVQITKRAMEIMGLAGGVPRKPRLPITEEEEAKLITLMENLEVARKVM